MPPAPGDFPPQLPRPLSRKIEELSDEARAAAAPRAGREFGPKNNWDFRDFANSANCANFGAQRRGSPDHRCSLVPSAATSCVGCERGVKRPNAPWRSKHSTVTISASDPQTARSPGRSPGLSREFFEILAV